MHGQAPRCQKKRAPASLVVTRRGPTPSQAERLDHAEVVLEAWTVHSAFGGAITCNCLGAERIALTAPECLSSHEAFTSAIGSATYAREELVAGIERIKRNLSRFIGEAECDELKRRQRQELVRSLEESHPDSLTTAEMGVENWNQGLPAEDHNLLDPRSAMPLQWSGQ